MLRYSTFYTLRRGNVILKPAEEMQLWDLRKAWKELLSVIFSLYHMQDADASLCLSSSLSLWLFLCEMGMVALISVECNV